VKKIDQYAFLKGSIMMRRLIPAKSAYQTVKSVKEEIVATCVIMDLSRQ